jgi:hypothetical protein
MKEAQLQAATLLAIEILRRAQPAGELSVDVMASAFSQACEAIRAGVKTASKEGHWTI